MNIKQKLLLALLLIGFTTSLWAQNTSSSANVTVQIDKQSAVLTAGDWVEFKTVLRNIGATATPALVVHQNIASLIQGRYVDPEDWSIKRTQYITSIQPGKSVQLSWNVHALIEGDFASFVTIVSSEKSFIPVVSMPLLLHVEPDDILPLKTVIPVVAIVPIFPLALLVFTVIYTRRRIRSPKI